MAIALLSILAPLPAVSLQEAPAVKAATVDAADDEPAAVIAADPVELPRDHGSHPAFRTEWWYVTGWLYAQKEPLGFQVTFFRSRTSPRLLQGNPSQFAPTQIIVAHAALSDPQAGHLRQDQRVARAGLGLAGASVADVDAWIGDWRLRRDGEHFKAQVRGEDFGLTLDLQAMVPALLNGERGYSQKGPASRSASHYYSLPHLRVSGSVTRGPKAAQPVTGEAWLDHEWSSEYLDSQAVGWDWTGLNLDDGSAVMAFRVRGRDGGIRWAGGTVRDAAGRVFIAKPDEVGFKPLRYWRSARTGIEFPVQWSVRVGDRRWQLAPLMDDQENDTRASTGAIYWEGAVSASQDAGAAGRGYLELTGYGAPLMLR